MEIEGIASPKKVLANILVLSLTLMLGACGNVPNRIPSNLDAGILKDHGIVVISTSADGISTSLASCLMISANPDNGDKGHCLMLDNAFVKSDFPDHYGQFYVLVLAPGHYTAVLKYLNPYYYYTNPRNKDFDVQAGQIMYMGDVYLIHDSSHANHLELYDRHGRDIALFHQHDPALAGHEVEMVPLFSDIEGARKLPAPPQGSASVLDTDYRLHGITAKDAAGHAIADVPATLMGILDDKADWDDSALEDLSAFPVAIPDALRSQVTLFYNKHTHWFVVPRGWAVDYTLEGSKGILAITFTAPTGAKDGWMRLYSVYDASACVGCMYGDADGILPRAHETLDKMDQKRTPEPILMPQPQSLTRMNTCTAVLRYQPPASPPASGVVHLQADDSEFADLYVALPDSQSALSNYITDEFLKTHSECSAK